MTSFFTIKFARNFFKHILINFDVSRLWWRQRGHNVDVSLFFLRAPLTWWCSARSQILSSLFWNFFLLTHPKNQIVLSFPRLHSACIQSDNRHIRSRSRELALQHCILRTHFNGKITNHTKEKNEKKSYIHIFFIDASIIRGKSF